MSNITKLFEDESTKAFNEIDDEALGQLGTELERIRLRRLKQWLKN